MKPHLHSKRGLSFHELGALLGVRAMLANGLLRRSKTRIAPKGEHVFNMGVRCATNESCGSVQCIGGAMGLILGLGTEGAQEYVDGASGKMKALFYPPWEYDYATISAAQAIKAIDNFLKTGHPQWRKILRKSQLLIK